MLLIMQAVGSSSHETSTVSSSLPSLWNGTWSHQFVTNGATAMLPNQTKVMKSMRCEVCKIDCNSNDVYEKHISGKKHKKNLQIQANPTNTILSGPSQANVQSQTSSIQGIVLTGGAVLGNELESKKRKVSNGGAPVDSVKVCTVCNVVCNSQEVFSKHLAGKKHAAQVNCNLNCPFVRLPAMHRLYILPFSPHSLISWFMISFSAYPNTTRTRHTLVCIISCIKLKL